MAPFSVTLKLSYWLRETPPALGAAIWMSGVWFAVSVTVGFSPAGAAWAASIYAAWAAGCRVRSPRVSQAVIFCASSFFFIDPVASFQTKPYIPAFIYLFFHRTIYQIYS